MLRDIKWISGMDLALHADLLIHDSQYTSQEYKDKVGWGHTSMEDAALFASLADVKKLLFFHHDPSHTDVQLNDMFSTFDKKSSDKLDMAMAMAMEGMEIELS
jgi:ribonuclease BN (tRNA processing enzyme)